MINEQTNPLDILWIRCNLLASWPKISIANASMLEVFVMERKVGNVTHTQP